MMKRSCSLALVGLLTLGGCSPESRPLDDTRGGEAQREAAGIASASSLEEWIRSGFAFEWRSGEAMPEEARQVWSRLGRGGVGYGFRTFEARMDSAGAAVDSAAQALVASMEYWRVTLDELHTSAVGDIGLAWGVYTEEFKAKGRRPETVRVRFTNTLMRDGRGWENLLYHRDAQAFGEDGSYEVPR